KRRDATISAVEIDLSSAHPFEKSLSLRRRGDRLAREKKGLVPVGVTDNDLPVVINPGCGPNSEIDDIARRLRLSWRRQALLQGPAVLAVDNTIAIGIRIRRVGSRCKFLPVS